MNKFWKIFFYPYSLISNAKWSFTCLLAFMVVLYVIPDEHTLTLVCVTVAYCFAGAQLSSETLLEWYNLVSIYNEDEEEVETVDEDEEYDTEPVRLNDYTDNILRIVYPTHPDTERVFIIRYVGSHTSSFNADLVNFGVELAGQHVSTIDTMDEFTIEWFNDRGYDTRPAPMVLKV